MLERMRRKGNPHTLLVGMWTGAATLENCVEVPQRVQSKSALRPSNCTIGILPQRYRCNETLGHLHPDVSSSNVHNSQTVEEASVSIERWMDNEGVVHTYIQWNISEHWVLFCMLANWTPIKNKFIIKKKKRQIPTICFNVDGTGGYYAEWNKSIGEGHCMVSFIWGI